MYIFNPEHDLCIANGDIHFVPPESALAFGRDCASIVKFMSGLDIDADKDIKIIPWGWNSVLCDRLIKAGVDKDILPSDQHLKYIKDLSHRIVAHEALEYLESQIKDLHCDANIGIRQIPANYRIAAKSVEEIEQFLGQNPNVVLKAPLSGSGKGIRFVADALSHSDSGWCKKLIAKHGYVVAEKRYQPVMEFAMLFKCSTSDNDTLSVNFIGYSLFYTQNGAYRGNVLASNDFIEAQITKYIPLDVLNNTKCRLISFLEEKLCGKYDGFVGVDQFVCGDYFPAEGSRHAADLDFGNLWYNPVVEINLRMTMGLIARNIYDRFAAEYNLQDGKGYFEICRNEPISGGYAYRIVQE